jgi:hypothetical protein
VTHRRLDLTLLATVYRLVEAVERGRLGLSETASALDEACTPPTRTRAGSRRPGRPGWPGRSRCCWARRGVAVRRRSSGRPRGRLRRIGRVPWGKVPPLVVALAGISPLLPGLTAYRGSYQLSVEGLADGLVTATLALATGLALASGVTLGQYLTRPQATVLDPADPAPEGDRQ